MSFRSLIAYNTLTQIIGKVLGIGFSIGTVILLTRYLGIVGFGQYNTAMVFVGFFVIVANLGIYEIAVREMAQNINKRAEIFGNVIFYRLFSALVIFLLAFLIGLLMPYAPILKLAIGIVALQSLIESITEILRAIFQIHYRMDLPTIIEILCRGLYFVLIFLAIELKFSLLGILGFFVVSTFINLILMYFLSLKFVQIKPQVDRKYWRYFILESWPLGLAAVLIMINGIMGIILLSFFKPMTDLGIYGIAYRIFANLILIPFIFADLILPKLSELYKTDRVRLKKFFQKAFDIILIVVFPIAILFFVMAPYSVYIIAGKDFIAASSPVKIVVIAAATIFLSAAFFNFLIASGKQKWLILSASLVAVLNIFLSLILIPRYSYNGAAFATLISEIIYLLVLIWLTNHLLNIKPGLGLAKKLILPSLILIIFLHFILSIPYFSLEIFSRFNLLKQIILVAMVFLSAGGLYLLVLFGLNIIPLNLIGAFTFPKKR
jgi:O-antigen/teichoic acid export membrane protein